MIQKKAVTPSGTEWNELIECLEIFKSTEQHHRILETIICSVKMIKEGHVDLDAPTFSKQLVVLLECCKLLDEIAKEFLYRKNIGEYLLGPLCHALQHQNALLALNLAIDYIVHYLPFENSVSIPYKRLCNHEGMYHEDFVNYKEENPHQKLLQIHVDCLQFAQSDLEKFSDVAVIMRVLDFWRTLSYNDFRFRDIQPLLELGDDLLVRIKESTSPLRKNALWRMVLLLQMLLRDHPAVRTLKLHAWPAEGFVVSLLPMDSQSSLSSHSSNNLSDVVLKDYESGLQTSRKVFESLQQDSADIFKAQHDHSQQVISMLEAMVREARNLLGVSPCEIVVCILGSTSRYDRRPYSDLEYMILHSEVPAEKIKEVDVYICHLISIFELMIVRLGETARRDSDNKGGLRIDTSVLESKCWGTPELVAKKYVTELTLPDALSPTHPWLDRGLFEYLHPVALDCPELGGPVLFKNYREALELYLSQLISEEDVPYLITRRFNIKRADWWKGLTRRQGIALASLCEVIHSNESAYVNLEVCNRVNLKGLYYKPLVYCALSLGMYQGWQEVVPSSIIQKYCDSLPWGGEALLLLWKAALGYVLKEQVKQHLNSHCQDDSMTVREDRCWAGLDLIVEGFILPLQRSLQACLSDALPIQTIAYALLKNYLNVRRAWLEKWEAKGLTRSELLTHPLMAVLTSYPDESGWSPQMELILKQHHEGLLKLSSDRITACEFGGLPVEGKQPARYLNEEIMQQCFENGEFVGDPKLSSERSRVKKVTVGDKSWYIKVKEGNLEGLMGREYLAMMLHLLLGGKPQIALGWPIKLALQHEGKTKPFYAWISEEVKKESFAAKMRSSSAQWSSLDFERENFSQLFLFTFLTCPEDGQPENFKIIESEGKIKLIAIDYGQCFVMAERQEKRFFGKDVSVLTIKTMIYLLDAMNEPIAQDLITRIRLLDVNAWYSSWQASLEGVNALFKPLLEKEAGPILRLIDIPEGILLCIKSRLELLQHWLRTTQKPITAQTILESLEPLVASQYTSLKSKIKTPDDFYQKIDVKAYVKDPKSGKMISSATWVALQQQTLTPQQLAKSCDLKPSYFRRVDFKQLSEVQQEYHVQLLETVAESYGKDFIKLNLSGCGIEENRLIRLLEKMSRLQFLSLTDCTRINVITVAKILAHRPGATIFTYNYEVLCPLLQQIDFALEGKSKVLTVNLDKGERQHMAKELTVFVQSFVNLHARLIEWLSSGDEVRYLSAAVYLARLGYRNEVIDIMMSAIENVDSSYKSLHIELLGELGEWNDRIREYVLKAVEDKHFYARERAIDTLGKIGQGDEAVRAVLLKVMEHADSERVQVSALHSFVNLGQIDEVSRPILLMVIKSVRSNILRITLELIVKLRNCDDSTVQEIVLDSSTVKFSGFAGFLGRVELIKLIGNLGYFNDEIRSILLRAMEDDYYIVREQAAISLGKLGIWDDEVRSILLKSIIEDKGNLQRPAAESFVKLGRWDKEIHDALLGGFFRNSQFSSLISFFTPQGCLRHIEYKLKSLSINPLEPIQDHENNKIIKRIFSFADAATQKILPQVCRKWRDLYAEFQEDQMLGSAPELNVVTTLALLPPASNVSFFRNVSSGQASGSDELVDDLNSTPLQSLSADPTLMEKTGK